MAAQRRKKMAKKTLRNFYVVVFSYSLFFSFMVTTYVPFLAKNGLNKFQISGLNAVFMLLVFLLEIPTGTFADTLGRKKSSLISLLLLSASCFVYYLSSTFLLFLVAEVISALALSFNSGALEAWLVDTLKHHNYEGDLKKVFSQESIIRNIACIIGGLSGAYVGKTNLAMPWLICSLGLLFTFFLSQKLLREEYFVVKKLNGFREKTSHFNSLVKDSVNYGFRNKNIFWLICLSAGLTLGVQPFNMFWTLKLKQHFDQGVLGWMWVFISLMIMLGSFSGQKLSTKITKQKYVLFIELLVTATSFLACVVFFNHVGWLILFCGLQESGRGGFDPIKRAYFNKRIPSDKRATIISFDSMIQHLGAFVGLLIGGWIANKFSIRASWVFSGLVIFFISFLCLKLNGDKK